MIIDDKRKASMKQFNDLELGDVFDYVGTLYLRIDGYKGLDLVDYQVLSFDGDEVVTLTNATLTISN